MRLPALTWTQVFQIIALAVLAAVTCLSPVHNDTWWHLAYGREMAAAGGYAQVDWFSHTAYGRPFPNHQWLGERVLYAVAAAGGLPLLTAFCAGLIVAAWMLVWHLTRGPRIDRLLLTMGAVASSTLVWSVRPQVFTIALLPLVAFFAVRDRLLAIPLLILVWANLHGGVLLGLIVLASAVLCAVLWNRSRIVPRAACLTASIGATLVTPLGPRYWPEILASLQRSQANRIHEWQQTPWPPHHLLFWIAAVALIVLVVTRRRSLNDQDGVVVLSALALLPAAARTLRNVAPFMMLAAPAIARLLWTRDVERKERPAGLAGWVASTAAAVACIGVVWFAWSVPHPRLGWQPIGDAAARAIAACPDPLYNRYADGGPIIWFVPGKKVLVDSRQDQYPRELVQEVTRIENTGDYTRLFSSLGIACAALPPESPTVAALMRDGWQLAYADRQWRVLVRPSAATGAGSSPAP